MGDWKTKFRNFIREAAEGIGPERPKLVKPRRDSGPRVLPIGWHTPEMQKRICAACSLPIVGNIELHEGRFCGPCWTFAILPGRNHREPEPPRAA
jgi:hypothetical protein